MSDNLSQGRYHPKRQSAKATISQSDNQPKRQSAKATISQSDNQPKRQSAKTTISQNPVLARIDAQVSSNPLYGAAFIGLVDIEKTTYLQLYFLVITTSTVSYRYPNSDFACLLITKICLTSQDTRTSLIP